MPYEVRMVYAHPERIRRVPAGDGSDRVFGEREPGSPVRPARAWELNSWFEAMDIGTADLDGADIREV